MAESSDPVLAIDLGTTYTVAAVRRAGRAPEVMEIGGDRRMPGTVVMGADGHLLVGRAAEDLADARPGDALRAPKRRLGDPAPVVLGGRTVPVVDLVAAVLRRVHDEATVHLGAPPTSVRLTHPASWSRGRLDDLVAAADRAGFVRPLLVPEPLAAAIEYGSEVAMDDGACVAVYDLGGGTFDAAVLRSNGGALGAVGQPAGDSALGGELFDELLLHHVGERLDTEAWDQLCRSDELAWRRAASALRREVRRAKEALAEAPEADLLLPLPDGLVHVRMARTELEAVVEPYVARSVEVFRACVERSGVGLEALAAVYLVGGASRMPLVARMLIDAVGPVPVRRLGDPKAVVALGAARAEPDPSTVRSVGTAVGVATARSTVVEPVEAAAPVVPAPPAGAETDVDVGPPPARRRIRLVAAAGAAAVSVAVAIAMVATHSGGRTAGASTSAVSTATATSVPAVLDAAVQPATTTTAAPTTTTESVTTTTAAPLALDQAGLDALLLAADEAASATGRSDWRESAYTSPADGFSFCGRDGPQPIRRSATQFNIGSGGGRRRIIAQANQFRTPADLSASDEVIRAGMRDCPQPSFVRDGVTHTLSIGTLVDRTVAGADLAYTFEYVNAYSEFRQASYNVVVNRGLVSLQVIYDTAAGALDDAERAAVDAMADVMAARLVALPA